MYLNKQPQITHSFPMIIKIINTFLVSSSVSISVYSLSLFQFLNIFLFALFFLHCNLSCVSTVKHYVKK